MPKKLIIVCLINFLIAALLGLALRYSYLGDLGFDYRFLTHAHSHVAMLGWVYLMLYTLITHYFIPNNKPIFNRLFWVTQIAVIGMLFSFPFQGYALISITFSTLHIFCSYYFVYLVWKHHKTNALVTSYLLKAALLFMVFSTFGVWCLGPAVAKLGQASAFYQIAIQFFLHFQFNGWFLIGVIAVLFHVFKVVYSKKFQYFFKLLIAATVLTFALPIHWFAPHFILPYLNGLGTVLQLIMFYFLLKIIQPKTASVLKNQSKLVVYLYWFSMFCFILKIGVQLLGLLPEFLELVYTRRNLVIGFIHLLMLGVITGFLFSFILQNTEKHVSKSLYFGVYIFIIGFALTEVLLVIQGFNFYFGNGLFPNYYLLLFIFSTFLPLGISLILFNIFKIKIMEHKPLKRHIALQPLSREHHFGLLLCWKIRTGFSKSIDPTRIRSYANWFFKNHLIPHFEIEETHIFPVLGNDNALVQKALEDHKTIKRLFAETGDNKKTLTEIETVIEQHIRFEERVLFPELQKIATQVHLLQIEKIHQSETFVDNTIDVFWK